MQATIDPSAENQFPRRRRRSVFRFFAAVLLLASVVAPDFADEPEAPSKEITAVLRVNFFSLGLGLWDNKLIAAADAATYFSDHLGVVVSGELTSAPGYWPIYKVLGGLELISDRSKTDGGLIFNAELGSMIYGSQQSSTLLFAANAGYQFVIGKVVPVALGLGLQVYQASGDPSTPLLVLPRFMADVGISY